MVGDARCRVLLFGEWLRGQETGLSRSHFTTGSQQAVRFHNAEATADVGGEPTFAANVSNG
jgi:hypothetical protein